MNAATPSRAPRYGRAGIPADDLRQDLRRGPPQRPRAQRAGAPGGRAAPPVQARRRRRADQEADNPAQKVAEPRRLPTIRRALPDARLAQISEVTAALRAATLAAMLEPARPRRAEPGQAMAAAAQQPSHPMTAPYRRDKGNPTSSLISAPACYKASLRARRSRREIRPCILPRGRSGATEAVLMDRYVAPWFDRERRLAGVRGVCFTWTSG